MYEKEVTLIEWSAPACLLCGQTRQIIIEEDDRSCERGAGEVRLNRGFRSDLQCFLPAWNSRGMMSNMVKGKPQVVLTSDASGSWGCCAYLISGEWFQLELPSSWAGVHITIKELLPIVIGAAVWGRQWKGRSVLCLCDNAAIVAV